MTRIKCEYGFSTSLLYNCRQKYVIIGPKLGEKLYPNYFPKQKLNQNRKENNFCFVQLYFRSIINKNNLLIQIKSLLLHSYKHMESQGLLLLLDSFKFVPNSTFFMRPWSILQIFVQPCSFYPTLHFLCQNLQHFQDLSIKVNNHSKLVSLKF